MHYTYKPAGIDSLLNPNFSNYLPGRLKNCRIKNAAFAQEREFVLVPIFRGFSKTMQVYEKSDCVKDTFKIFPKLIIDFVCLLLVPTYLSSTLLPDKKGGWYELFETLCKD